MPRQARKESGTGIFHVMMRGINHQNIFEDEEDNWQFINTLDRMRKRYDDDGNPCGINSSFYAYCLDMDDPSRVRPSDDQVCAYIKEMTGATNSSAFQQLDNEARCKVLKNLKERGASHRQLERLTGIGRGVIQKL